MTGASGRALVRVTPGPTSRSWSSTRPGVLRRPGQGFPTRPTLGLPFPSLAGAALAIGHNFAVKEAGGTARAFWPVLAWQGVGIPSLGLSAALAAAHISTEDVRLQA